MSEMRRHARRRGGRGLAGIAFALAALTLAGAWFLRPTGGGDRPNINQFGAVKDTYFARIESVRTGPCPGADPSADVRCQTLTIRLLEGPDRGKTFSQQTTLSPGAPELSEGDGIVAGRQENPQPGFEYTFVDRQRKAPLFWLAVIFGAAVLLLGRFRGAASLIGLGSAFAVLLSFVVPAILDGRNPVAVSLVGASMIAFLALYLAHGLNARTTIALMGTLGGLATTAILAVSFQGITYITGFASEEARFLLAVGAEINLSGLILGGVIIGALGAIDDITVTQASAIWELHEANPTMGRARLFRSGMRIGRDHVASTVNTLALAYVGASMPVLLLFVLSNQALSTVANGEIVATEIFRTLVGSIGLIASVPITTLLAARFVAVARQRGRRDEQETPEEDQGDEFFVPERRRDAYMEALRETRPRRRQ
jgi:uncharacterized membrane protein